MNKDVCARTESELLPFVQDLGLASDKDTFLGYSRKQVLMFAAAIKLYTGNAIYRDLNQKLREKRSHDVDTYYSTYMRALAEGMTVLWFGGTLGLFFGVFCDPITQ